MFIRCALCLLLFLLSLVAEARPRVALVLSGGGARGIAHVGVIRELEAQRIPVDCIVGTSMGAIVGGGYATGLRAEAMQAKVASADWDYLFADRPRRADIPYFRKRDDWQDYFDLQIGLRGWQPVLPRRLIGVQHIALFFRDIVPGLPEVDFDHLPIPFRAVGADLLNGEPVIMAAGELSEVMRASMSVPGAFPPIEYRGRVVVDGGLARNLDIGTARELCGDVVIAVNVASPAAKREELGSVLAVAEQVVTMTVLRDLRAQLATLTPRDVLIEPNLGGLGSADFAAARAMIEAGAEAVRSAAPQLQRYQLDAADYAAWRAQVETKRHEPQPMVRTLAVAPTAHVSPAVLQSLLSLERNRPLDQAALHRHIDHLYARGDFDSLTYRLQPVPDGVALTVVPAEQEARDSARVGLSLYTDFARDSGFRLNAGLRRAWLNPLGGEWRLEGSLGDRLAVTSELYQPLVLNGEFFVAPSVEYSREVRDRYLDSIPVGSYETRRAGAGLEFGSILGRWGEVRAGLRREEVDSDPEIGTGPLPEEHYTLGAYTLHAVYDQIDQPRFPRQGSLVRLDYTDSSRHLGADSTWRRLELEAREAASWRRYTVLLGLRLGSSFEDSLPTAEAFTLGGLMNLSAYRRHELSGNHLLLGRLLLYRELMPLPSGLGRAVYGGAMAELGNVWQGTDDIDLEPDTLARVGSLFLGADTRLGPVYGTVSVGNDGHRAVHLAIGIVY